MDVSKSETLSDEQVQFIRRFIIERRGSPDLQNYVNRLLREDILTLLDQFCTVIYYPLTDEQNNGFHVEYPCIEERINFVYINTNQAKEKQIFTAAHELGHIWGLDQAMEKTLGIKLNHQQVELVMNRFAAELLMPEDLCRNFVKRKINELPPTQNSMKVIDLLRLAAAVMNEYFVPYKAVVRRLFELGFIPEKTAGQLLGRDELPLTTLHSFLETVAQCEGYSRLFQIDQRKWIQGLKELLDRVSKTKGASECRIDMIRQQFGLPTSEPASALSNLVSVQEEKEAGCDGKTGCD